MQKLAESCGYPVTVLLTGKGLFQEDHPSFTGCFFRGFTDPVSVRQMVETSDGLLLVGE